MLSWHAIQLLQPGSADWACIHDVLLQQLLLQHDQQSLSGLPDRTKSAGSH
jgi:hypothetical protein